ncbi:MAG: S4 domain-containing protein, partial [Alphaproteobacteria bacterium]
MNKPQEEYELAIKEQAAGQRLDHFLVRELPGLSRTRLQDLIVQGHVKLAQTPVLDTAHKVKAGQVYSVTVP